MSKTNSRLQKSDILTILDTACACLLALCPFLQHYQGVMVDSRATVLLILVPYLLARMFQLNRVVWLPVLPLILFSLVKIVDKGTNVAELGREGMVCLVFLAAVSGAVDVKKVLTAMTVLATVGCGLILVQTVCYYLLDYHIQLIPTQMFLSSSDQWMGMAETGKISILGNPMNMYRPSAIFMEPSHAAIYSTPPLLMLLLSPGFNWRRCLAAVIITAGVVASTSGLGIVLCMGLWFLYLALYCGEGGENKPILFIKGFSIKEIHCKGIAIKGKRYGAFTIPGVTIRPINIVVVIALFVAAVLMYFFVDVFQNAINRILFSEDGYNAIDGRTSSGMLAVSKLVGSEWLTGKAVEGTEASWYMSGFFESMYKYGLIGTVISYVFYVNSLCKLKRQYCWFALLLLGLSYFTNHTHGSAFMLLFCVLLLGGYREQRADNLNHLSLRFRPFGFERRKETVNE